jgi:molybdopterin-guanine dinucleotide biosynthesis protein A
MARRQTRHNDPVTAAARIDGCVLAGGPGRRLGRPKADVRLGELTLVERAVATLRARCREVVVVSRPGVALPPLDVPVVFDRPGPDAPLVAVATGLGALDGDEVVVLGCDLPFADGLIDELLEAPAGIAVVGTDRGRPQPLCARYPRRRTLEACERLLAVDALPVRGLLDAVGALGVEASGHQLLNVNTPEDLARARALLGEIGA